MTVQRLGLALALTSLAIATGCGSSGSKSNGPKVAVPRAVQNAYPADAIAALCSAGLNPLIVSAPPIKGAGPNVNGYAVKAVIPPVGSAVPRGSAVQLQLVTSVNGGQHLPGKKRQIAMPDVVGIDVNQAIELLTSHGLKVDATTNALVTSLDVTKQSPGPNSPVDTGSTVTLSVGSQSGSGCHS